MPKKKAKKKRAKPFDRRKLPHYRAPIEAAKKHDITGPLSTAFLVFWDSRGDWQKFDEWFLHPKIQLKLKTFPESEKYYGAIKEGARSNRDLFERAYADALQLYLNYTPPIIKPL